MKKLLYPITINDKKIKKFTISVIFKIIKTQKVVFLAIIKNGVVRLLNITAAVVLYAK